MYIFTDELHQHGRTELACLLAPTWGILSDYRDGLSQQSFPIDVLRAIGVLIAERKLSIEEGSIFECSSSPLDNLEWPKGVSALMAINHNFLESGVDIETSVDKRDSVEILVLIPLPTGASWSKGPAQLKKVLESMRKARLQKIMMTDPLYSAS
jgi:hypothetical protein